MNLQTEKTEKISVHRNLVSKGWTRDNSGLIIKDTCYLTIHGRDNRWVIYSNHEGDGVILLFFIEVSNSLQDRPFLTGGQLLMIRFRILMTQNSSKRDDLELVKRMVFRDHALKYPY